MQVEHYSCPFTYSHFIEDFSFRFYFFCIFKNVLNCQTPELGELFNSVWTAESTLLNVLCCSIFSPRLGAWLGQEDKCLATLMGGRWYSGSASFSLRTVQTSRSLSWVHEWKWDTGTRAERFRWRLRASSCPRMSRVCGPATLSWRRRFKTRCGSNSSKESGAPPFGKVWIYSLTNCVYCDPEMVVLGTL